MDRKKLEQLKRDIENQDSFNSLFPEIDYGHIVFLSKSLNITENEFSVYYNEIQKWINSCAGTIVNVEKDYNEKYDIKPYDFSKISMSTRTITLQSIINRLENDEIKLDPDFQRNEVWDNYQKSRLLESIILGIPIQMFYFDATNNYNWIVVDGLQRLLTFKRFFIDQTLKLEGLEYLSQFKGLSAKKMPQSIIRRMMETELQISLINQGTPEDVKYNLFKRINTGGKSLTDAEVRYALSTDKLRVVINELAKSPSFISAVKVDVGTQRMVDRDMVFRFLAYALLGVETYLEEKSLDNFLQRAIIEFKSVSDEQYIKLKEQFFIGLDRSVRLFGKYAFKKKISYNNNFVPPLNRNLFDAEMYLLSKLEDNDYKILINEIDKFNDKITNITENDNRFLFSLNSAVPNYVKYRFDCIQSIIKEVIKNAQKNRTN